MKPGSSSQIRLLQVASSGVFEIVACFMVRQSLAKIKNILDNLENCEL